MSLVALDIFSFGDLGGFDEFYRSNILCKW